MVLSTGSSPAVLKDQGIVPPYESVCFLSKLTFHACSSVCSPGGTTIAGIDELEKGYVNDVFFCFKKIDRLTFFVFACSGLRSAIISAVKAATRRSFQLGGLNDQEIGAKYNL